MRLETIAVQPGKTIKVILKEDSKMLDEVVVVGYGTQRVKGLDRCCHECKDG
ncbi:MAG: hypothetical protein ACLUVG_06875 [Phocaeicola vulgatus]